MKPTAKLHESGQSLWLDNISREMLDSGQLQRYIDEYSVTGLTSNPSIFDKAIASGAYDDEIRRKAAAENPEELFFELAFKDLGRAADQFEPIHRRTRGVDGWVSLEVSPLLADDASRTVQAAADLHARAGRENLFIKIPGTQAGRAAIEESIFAGVPVNVTLLFSREHYLAAADAYLRGIERRVAAGLDPDVDSVASVPRIRSLQTRSTCAASARRTRSTPCPNQHWSPSTTTAWSMRRCRRTAVMPTPRWPSSKPPASTSLPSGPSSSPTAQRASSTRGTIC